MIGRISGDLIYIKPPQVLVDVAGIGYEIDLPMSDCADLQMIGSSVTLFTHLTIREDAHSLYGFLSQDGRDCFRQLIKVSGIGPRIALALLSTLTLSEIYLAIDKGDVATLCRTPGIGKKVAERMLLELKGKLNFMPLFTDSGAKVERVPCTVHTDIIHALSSLGYADKEINQVMKQIDVDIIDLGQGIKSALKLLNKHT